MGWRESEWAIRQAAGSTAAKAVLLVLAEASKEGACFLSQETIAERAEMARRTVVREMKKLEERGLISRTRRLTSRGHRTSDLIKLNSQISEGMSRRARQLTPSENEVGSQDAKWSASQAPDATVLSASLAQEPVCEPGAEPVNSLEPRTDKAPSKERGRLGRLPDDFPDAPARELIAQRYRAAGLAVDIDAEVERFRDHHLARDTRSADWLANLRTWVSKGVDYAIVRHMSGRHSGARQGGWSALEEEFAHIARNMEEK